MNPTALRLVILSALATAALYTLGFTEPLGHDQPTSGIAAVGAPLPVFFIALAIATQIAASRLSRRAAPEQRLLVRVGAKSPPTPDGNAAWAATCATWLTGLAMTFVASLGGASWSDAWSCTSTGPGETSCNLTTGTWSTMYFVIGLFVVFGFGLGLIASLWSLRSDLRALAGLGEPIVELSSGQLFAGVPFRLRVMQRAGEGSASLKVNLRCTESATHGSGDDETTDTVTVYDQTIGRSHGDGAWTTLEATAAVPAGTMHTFRGKHHKVTWELVIESDGANGSRSDVYEVPVSPATPEAWRAA